MGVNCLLAAAVLGGFVASAVALQCYQCGQYNDGVGSITPCINETHMELKECPSLNHVYCIVSMRGVPGSPGMIDGDGDDGDHDEWSGSGFIADGIRHEIETFGPLKIQTKRTGGF
ncbi:hypothetical protein MTP99_016528 [Tenebrio molitor]|jgi:hypothetical protein|uniref:Secreted protein n=1 Tax=Tenebrio molitor TaxID=7067 RepID=A0A8J6HSX2_TENMO|nr:hypothetical protein GEV33_002708 [Tenebrio molitor]KAJ3625999.1 hypothetical protein MTP99_016528 [Tenebrio molitor]